VIACYFHRTVRCPTCQRISAYIEESVKTGFASQVKDGSVKIVMIDFQDAKNQKFTQAYQITGPTLVLMDVKDNKVVSWKPAPKVWTLVADKDAFFKYVQEEVKTYLNGKETASR
jgi:thiol-disulfide isomerase/thioredoxin